MNYDMKWAFSPSFFMKLSLIFHEHIMIFFEFFMKCKKAVMNFKVFFMNSS